jgi:rhomboid family protein
MIPLRDNVPRSSWPLITVALIVVNCLIFFREVSLFPNQRNAMIHQYSLIPARTAAFLEGRSTNPAPAVVPLFTSMFLHGGWLHLIGNMWFLWIFGDNVEDRVGHLRFLYLYLLSGLAGALAELFFSLDSTVPMLGASGAIAGVMGAYLITFPGARILTLVPIFFFLTTIEVPAFLMLFYWLVLQFFSGVASIGAGEQGGVAWFAHVGGFLTGVPLMLLLRRPRRRFRPSE